MKVILPYLHLILMLGLLVGITPINSQLLAQSKSEKKSKKKQQDFIFIEPVVEKVPQPPSTEPSEINPSKIVPEVAFGNVSKIVLLKREGCFGKCPVYEATFYSNGEVQFIGFEHVNQTGQHAARIPVEEAQKIQELIQQYNLLSLKDSYPSSNNLMMLDFPVTRLELQTQKTIVSRYDSPTILIEFQDYLDQLLKDFNFL